MTYNYNMYDKIEIMNKYIPDQPNEVEVGNREYKLKITRSGKLPSSLKCNKLASQMKWRLHQGNGKAIYLIGVKDKGDSCGINKKEMFISLLYILKATNIIEADIEMIRLYKGKIGTIASVRISMKMNKVTLYGDNICN